jgi:cysteine desulfurase
MNLPVYLDNNATTPCDERVVEAMLPYFTHRFGNAASRTHLYGWQAEEAVQVAREQIADLIGAEKEEIVFTSGATEADNLAIKGVFEMYAGKGNHFITVNTEHKAVLDTVKHIEKLGGSVSCLEVGKDGLVDLESLEASITQKTIMIAVMYANNEIGVIQPVAAIGKIAAKYGLIFFSDAAQAAGKISIDVQKDGIGLMALSAHKIYGPKGVGALYVRRKNPRLRLTAQMDGGGHERGMRSGTLNVPGIVGFGKAAAISKSEMPAEMDRLGQLRNKLENALLRAGDTQINGNREYRLPNTTNISFVGTEANLLMAGFNKEIAVSSGSACTSASLEPSYVLKALGLSSDLAHSSLRFSLGRFNTEQEIDYVIDKLSTTLTRIRGGINRPGVASESVK